MRLLSDDGDDGVRYRLFVINDDVDVVDDDDDEDDCCRLLASMADAIASLMVLVDSDEYQ